MAFSDNLKTVRQFRGKKPMDVVNETKIAKAKYYAYEAGQYEPGPDIVDQLAEYFKVKRSVFFEKKLTEEDVKNSLAAEVVPEKKVEYVPIHVLDHYRNTSEHIMEENKNLWQLVKELRAESRTAKQG